MAKSYRVTSVGITPAEDRAKRMRFYFVAMSMRVACIASLFFVRGWWVLLVGVGAVVLPYLAVVIANAASNTVEERPEAPQPRELTADDPVVTTDTAPPTIVVDGQVHRRADSSRHSSDEQDPT